MVTLYGDKLSVRQFAAVLFMWFATGTYALSFFWASWWCIQTTLPNPSSDSIAADLHIPSLTTESFRPRVGVMH